MKKSRQLALKGGSYSLILTLVVIAILVVVNIGVSALPATITKYDISSTKLYSITSNTKVVVNSLEKDVNIYWIVQADKEDEIIENLLEKYDSLSTHIQVIKKNPDVFPTFAEQYTDSSVQNNSLVIECGDRFRYVPYSDIYVQEADMYSYTYTTSFDGEGAITSAIDYVVNEELPQLYVLEGHGEGELPTTFKNQIEKANIEIQSLSLLTVDGIPEDASCIMIYAPQSDISDAEKDMISDYVKDGGKLYVICGPVEDQSFERLNSILEDHKVLVKEGVVVEADRNHYAFQRPYILIPDMTSSSITDSLMEANYYPIIPIASGLSVSTNATNVTALLTTSDASFSKIAGLGLTTYEKEDGDIDGGFALAVSIDVDGGGKIIWFSSGDFLQDMYNAYSSGANTDLSMNALSYAIGEREALAIRSKSLNYNYLTISESQGSMLKAMLIFVIPFAYLGIGVVVVVLTRRKQHETV